MRKTVKSAMKSASSTTSLTHQLSPRKLADTHLLVIGRVPDGDQQASQEDEGDPQREE